MNLDRVGSGNIPDEINVIIEIPAHSDPVKYEVDKDSGPRRCTGCHPYPPDQWLRCNLPPRGSVEND